MNQEKRLKILRRFKEQNPHPTTELIYNTPFELLISVMLSAQATDVSVNKATTKLFPIANTAKAILDLGEEKLKSYIKTIGLYNSKAKNIIATCRLLIEKFASNVPETREALESLPGVGRKTANVVLATLYEQAAIAVDTHVFRVSNRTKFAPGKTPLAVEKKLLHVIPTDLIAPAHHWFILHGRYTCIARKPKCYACIIRDLCEYPNKTIAE